MSALDINLIAVVFYLLAASYVFISLWRSKPVQRQYLYLLTAVALIAHGTGCALLIVQPKGLALSLFPVSSLIFCTVNIVVLLSAARKPLHNLFIILFPLTIVAIITSLLPPSNNVLLPLTVGLTSHILLSILAYSLLTIATLQALFLAFQNHRLKQKRSLGPRGLLPPLQTMESLLFELLWAGQLLLTGAIISGIIFLDDIFAQHVVHKTVFTLFAWLIYSILLWGRHSLGWRGYTAIRWTLVGFVMLMLAYFGSKIVLEFILNI
ncbi:cytochrome C assembly family protein [Gilvimarinus polysaccharolyticus]|uniref:cytochrome C assembly family protein n=1 Tax=Gilvimarinus polysaccharolyticus TaxID=863921 RepID=UPI000673944C|nr:cytochrome c biogenesis protein CcsA [Gilvimarinus polysaccharolyticus]